MSFGVMSDRNFRLLSLIVAHDLFVGGVEAEGAGYRD